MTAIGQLMRSIRLHEAESHATTDILAFFRASSLIFCAIAARLSLVRGLGTAALPFSRIDVASILNLSAAWESPAYSMMVWP